MATNSIITVDVLNGYLSCKYKAYLQLSGQHGIKSDYEATLVELRQEVRLKAIEKIHRQFPEHTLTRNIALTDSALKRGAYFVLDAQLEDNRFSIHFDALKRADGGSDLGDFHYQPVLFYEGHHIRKAQRTLLETLGLLLSRIQGRAPSRGIIYHGSDGTATTVRFSADFDSTWTPSFRNMFCFRRLRDRAWLLASHGTVRGEEIRLRWRRGCWAAARCAPP